MSDPTTRLPPRNFAVGDRPLDRARDAHPDWTAGFGLLNEHSLIGASAIGRLHLREGTPRDDAFSARSSGPWLAVAVADGAGSRPLSRLGAALAADTLTRAMLEQTAQAEPPPAAAAGGRTGPTSTDKDGNLPERSSRRSMFSRRSRPAAVSEESTQAKPPGELPQPQAVVTFADTRSSGTLAWHRNEDVGVQALERPRQRGEDALRRDLEAVMQTAFGKTHDRLATYADAHELELGDLTCTLLGLLIDTRGGSLAAGHVGDGAIALLDTQTGVERLAAAPTPPDQGEVYAITQLDWENYFAVEARPPSRTTTVASCMLMSDGVHDDCKHPPPDEIFSTFVQDMDREMRSDPDPADNANRLVNFLATYEKPGSYDDRTLAIVARAGADQPADDAVERDEPQRGD